MFGEKHTVYRKIYNKSLWKIVIFFHELGGRPGEIMKTTKIIHLATVVSIVQKGQPCVRTEMPDPDTKSTQLVFTRDYSLAVCTQVLLSRSKSLQEQIACSAACSQPGWHEIWLSCNHEKCASPNHSKSHAWFQHSIPHPVESEWHRCSTNEWNNFLHQITKGRQVRANGILREMGYKMR